MATASTQAYRNQVLEEVDKIPYEFLPSVLKMIQAFREGITLPTAEASFRQGLKEAHAGETRPIEKLWDGIDAR